MVDATKDRILQACNKLMREKPFEKITVSLIIKRSGVSKSTFYRYFLDKYDVMNYNYKRNLDSWIVTRKCTDWHELYYCIFSFSIKDKKREKNAYAVVGTNSYSKFLHDYSYQIIEQMTITCRGTPLTREEEFNLSLFCYGGIAMNVDWLNGKLNYTVDEMTDLIFMSMPISMRYLWKQPT
ncbi:MAG: TetR/AcrR family transcriptional regulator [Clostridia bacterium]|nr:TetR/AcrR family transcriptional regulator [Clostridia bacterium]